MQEKEVTNVEQDACAEDMILKNIIILCAALRAASNREFFVAV